MQTMYCRGVCNESVRNKGVRNKGVRDKGVRNKDGAIVSRYQRACVDCTLRGSRAFAAKAFATAAFAARAYADAWTTWLQAQRNH